MSRVAVPCQAEARELRRAGMSKEGTGRLAWGGAACPPLRLRMCAAPAWLRTSSESGVGRAGLDLWPVTFPLHLWSL